MINLSHLKNTNSAWLLLFTFYNGFFSGPDPCYELTRTCLKALLTTNFTPTLLRAAKDTKAVSVEYGTEKAATFARNFDQICQPVLTYSVLKGGLSGERQRHQEGPETL